MRRSTIALALAGGAAAYLVGSFRRREALRYLWMRLREKLEPGVIMLERDVVIDTPRDEAFSFWTAMDEFPRYFSEVRSVRPTGEGQLHFAVHGPDGQPLEWDAQVTRCVPEKVIAWRSAKEAPVRSSGKVRYEGTVEGKTRLRLRMKYRAIPEERRDTLPSYMYKEPVYLATAL
jgi:uncharacterized membrane protein